MNANKPVAQVRLAALLLFGSALVLIAFLGPQPALERVDRPSVAPIAGEAQMGAMIESGACWTGGEGHPVPSRVWVREAAGNTHAYVLRGERVVGLALEQMFEGADHDVEGVAFCE